MVRVACIVVIADIPEALRGHANSLSFDLTDDSLHYNFVTIILECLDLSLNLAHDLFCPAFSRSVVVLLIFQVCLDDILNDLLYLRRVESNAKVSLL